MTDHRSKDDRVYVSFAQVAECKVCGRTNDLRMGACWDCADHVEGEDLGNGNHRLWDSRNPRNEWFVSERGH